MWTRLMCVAAICFRNRSAVRGRWASSHVMRRCSILRRKVFRSRRRAMGTEQGSDRRANRSCPALSERFAGTGGHERQYNNSLTA